MRQFNATENAKIELLNDVIRILRGKPEGFRQPNKFSLTFNQLEKYLRHLKDGGFICRVDGTVRWSFEMFGPSSLCGLETMLMVDARFCTVVHRGHTYWTFSQEADAYEVGEAVVHVGGGLGVEHVCCVEDIGTHDLLVCDEGGGVGAVKMDDVFPATSKEKFEFEAAWTTRQAELDAESEAAGADHPAPFGL